MYHGTMVTYANGQIPTSAMTRLSVGGYLLPAAANNFELWRAHAARDNRNLTITSAADAFREYAIQERIFRARYTTTYLPGRPTKRWNNVTWYLKPNQATAAVPGTSNHGKGLAVDIKNAGGFGGSFYKWMAATGPLYGWSNAEGRSINEPWHWVNDNKPRGALGSIGGALAGQEDDMPSAQEVANAVLDTLIPRAGLAAGGSTTLRQQIAWGDDHTIQTVQAIQAAIPVIVNGVLNTPIPKGGRYAGNVTTLAAVASWHDEHITLLAEGDAANKPSAPVDQEALKAAITTSVQESLKDISITLTNKD